MVCIPGEISEIIRRHGFIKPERKPHAMWYHQKYVGGVNEYEEISTILMYHKSENEDFDIFDVLESAGFFEKLDPENIQLAVLSGNVPALRRYIKHGLTMEMLDNICEGNVLTLLIEYRYQHKWNDNDVSEDLVKTIVDLSRNPTIITEQGLMYNYVCRACTEGDVGLLQFLMKTGGTLDDIRKNNYRAARFACDNNSKKILEEIIRMGIPSDAIENIVKEQVNFARISFKTAEQKYNHKKELLTIFD